MHSSPKMHYNLEEEKTPEGGAEDGDGSGKNWRWHRSANVDPCWYPCEVGGHVLS